ncbi:putative zinc finger, C2H2 type [Lyophyllum shimeji]|uniref:Zinc finger, C2H2 type n=1 Tax=Lyophyllum shimeji TaxID=47721 RepID=A0A9P3PNQ1_LYOSH|nr:putative zinc finger, C2H2 type [Lyophyllum shimeji]
MDPHYSVLASQPSLDLKANGEISRMRSHKGIIVSSSRKAEFTYETFDYEGTCHHYLRRSTVLCAQRSLPGRPISTDIFVLILTSGFIVAIYARQSSRGAICLQGINEHAAIPLMRIARGESRVKLAQSQKSNATSNTHAPKASRNKKLASAKRKLSVASSSAGSVASSTSSQFTDALTSSPMEFPSTFSPFTSTTPMSTHSSLSATPALVSPGSSSTSSSHSSPRSEFFESQPDMSGTFDMSFDAYTLDSYINGAFSAPAVDPVFDSSITSCPPPQPGAIDDFSWLGGNEFYPNFSDEHFSFLQPQGYDDHFTTDFGTLTSTESFLDTSPRISADQISPLDSVVDCFFDPSSVVTNSQGPTSAELDHYLTLFFSAFCTQIPLVHAATWSMDDKPFLLMRAMQACGALFVKNDTATAFIDDTLASMRDALVQEFTKISTDPREQNHLILTVVLLQTIGLFHQKADQRISSNVYHGMLVMMIRRTGLIPRVGAWTPPDLNDPLTLDAAWREWANYETIKRVLFLSYLHDCCHCMYFSLSPSFQPAELDLCLPCDDALWSACDAMEWCGVSQAPSPYGTGNPRILGFPMKQALAVLGETRLSTVSITLNPFAHFILIHTILRNLYASYAENPSPDLSPTRIAGGEAVPGEEHDNAFAIQYALHNWLQMWLNSPESMQVEESVDEPPFIRNALPFYWLAQVSLLAIQDGSAVFGGKSSDAKAEGRFRLMKEWLDHIRTFLRTGNQIPTHLWDELMKIRSQMSSGDVQAGEDHQNGLLAFFPDAQ